MEGGTSTAQRRKVSAEISRASGQDDHTPGSPLTDGLCRPSDIFCSLSIIAPISASGAACWGCLLHERRRRKRGGCSFTHKGETLHCGRTQQIRLRLSPTFPRIWLWERASTDRGRQGGPLVTHSLISPALGPWKLRGCVRGGIGSWGAEGGGEKEQKGDGPIPASHFQSKEQAI